MYKDCKGKSNGHQIGDGTWCWDGRRDIQCPATDSKNINNHLKQQYHVAKENLKEIISML